MPKLVDHVQRRAEIISANLQIIARDGLAGATMRAWPRELGVANGAVGHYFKNQDELLQATYEEVFARTNARAAVQTKGRHGWVPAGHAPGDASDGGCHPGRSPRSWSVSGDASPPTPACWYGFQRST